MRTAVVAAGFGLAIAIAAAGPAVAAPPFPPAPVPPCTFTLSPPTVEGSAVTATVESTGCAAAAAPYVSVACLQPAGATVVCAQSRGTDPATVSVPWRAGTSYTATGRGGAGWVGLPPAPFWQMLGPITAAL